MAAIHTHICWPSTARRLSPRPAAAHRAPRRRTTSSRSSSTSPSRTPTSLSLSKRLVSPPKSPPRALWPTRHATCKELTAVAPLCLAGASRAISAASYANADSGLDCRLLFGPCDRAWQGACTARSAAGVRAGPASGQFTGGGGVR
jgi:hypothetical protein